MKINSLTVLLAVLVTVSVGTNLFTMYSRPDWKDPDANRYFYEGMFDNSILYYRPEGTNGLAMINMDGAIIVITKFEEPMHCAMLTIVTKDGRIDGPCIDAIPAMEAEPE